MYAYTQLCRPSVLLFSAVSNAAQRAMGGTRERQPLRIFKAGAWTQKRKPVRSTALKCKAASCHRAGAPRSTAPCQPRPTICDLLRRPTITIQDEAGGRRPASANLRLGPDAEQREPERLADDVASINVPEHPSTYASHNQHLLNRSHLLGVAIPRSTLMWKR